MAKVDLNSIKNWFKTGLKPTQAQFWNTWDSFFHKDDTIPQESIEGLQDSFDEKADAELLDNKLDTGGYTGTGQNLKDGQDAILNSLYQSNKVIQVTYRWVSDYVYKVIYVKWIKEGLVYEQFFNEEVTLDASDATFNRLDSVILNIDTVSLEKVTGDATATPSLKQLELNQLFLFFVPVDAGTTEPTGVSNEDVYLNDEEWVSSATGNAYADSITQPSTGTKSMEFAAAAIGDYVLLEKGGDLDITNATSLIMQVYLPAVSSNNLFAIVSSNATQSYSLLLQNNRYGFKKNTVEIWQTIVIPIKDLGIDLTVIESLKFVNVTAGASFFIDNVQIEFGTETPESIEFTPTGGYQGTAQDLKDLIDILTAGTLSEVIITEASQIVNKELDSNKVYVIDGEITIGTGESIIVPVGGLTIQGFGFNISSLFASADNHTIFTSPVGGSGDLILSHISVTTTGTGSKVFNIEDANGTHAVEIEYTNFSGCKSLGIQKGYRQGTWTTVGVYGCDDGLQLSGNWDGYKISNTNCFGFAATGTLFKKDVDTLFSNRLFLNVNTDFPTGAKLADFNNTNFSSNELFQVNSSIAKLNSTINEDNTALLIPNISANDAKSLFVGNIGLYNSADERYVENSAVTGTYAVNWLKDTYYLTMTGNTVFSENNLPASGKNSEEIKIYLTGNFIPTFPAGWLVNLVGTYKGDEINEITVKFVKTGVYFMSINNSLVVYPAPDLSSVNPTGLLPSTTSNLTLYGSFFTPATIVSIEGQTVNSVEFVNSGELIVNVTTGATEDSFDITISNGTSVTFANALTVVLGTVYIPTEADWTLGSGGSSLDLSENGNALIKSFNSTQKQATWNQVIDYTTNFRIEWTFKRSLLGSTFTLHHGFSPAQLIYTDNNAVAFKMSCDGSTNDSTAHSFRGVFSDPSSSLWTTEAALFNGLMPERKFTYESKDGTIKLYADNIVQRTFAGVMRTDLKIKVDLNYFDLVNIKYIALSV